jgi:hypothetical protein
MDILDGFERNEPSGGTYRSRINFPFNLPGIRLDKSRKAAKARRIAPPIVTVVGRLYHPGP